MAAEQIALEKMIEKAAADGDLADGDIFIFNDAHIGGTHLSDMRLVRPYFRDGELATIEVTLPERPRMPGDMPD